MNDWIVGFQDVPKWVSDNFKSECSCGYPIINTVNYTQRMCLNPQCPEHMIGKVVDLAKMLKVPNVGPATARDYVYGYSLTTPLDMIPRWFKEKPLLTLGEIGLCLQYDGLANSWNNYTIGCASFEEMFQKHPYGLPELMYACKEEICANQRKYFRVKPPITGIPIYVALTGSIDGYSNRNDFLKHINSIFGEFYNIINVDHAMTKASYLIKEPGAADHKKTQAALKYDIPIVSSQQFLQKLITACIKCAEEQGISQEEYLQHLYEKTNPK